MRFVYFYTSGGSLAWAMVLGEIDASARKEESPRHHT